MKETNPIDPELDQLISGFADGLLDEPGERRLADRLKNEPQARRRYLDYQALQGTLQWQYAEAAATPLPQPTVANLSSYRPMRWILPLAALVVVGLFTVWLMAGKNLVTIEISDGGMFQSGETEQELRPGDRLPAGSIRVEGESGLVQFSFPDGTQITLDGRSKLAFSETDEGKQLQLSEGSLSAQVAPQQSGKPLRITTEEAVIDVLGTILSVDAKADATRLSVDEGRVRLKRIVDGRELEVSADQESRASLNSEDPFEVQDTPEASGHWLLDVAAGNPQLTKGVVSTTDRNPFVTAVPYHAGRDGEGNKVIRRGISVNGNLAQLAPGSRVRIRYRSSSAPTLFLGTQESTGRFGGNFEYRPGNEEYEIDKDGWRLAEVEVSEFQAVAKLRERTFSLEDNRISKILVSVHDGNDLEVAELRVVGGGE